MSTETVIFASNLPVWKTVKLGLYKSPDDYRSALARANQTVSGWGDDLLGGIVCSSQETEVGLVILKVSDLGFKQDSIYEHICAKAVERGLELCPAEVGPALRLQYIDQPQGESLSVAAGDMTTRDNRPAAFCIVNERGRLPKLSGSAVWLFYPDDRLCFVKPRR